MLPRMVRLAELTWPEARRLAHSRRSVVLLPLGAIEQHGPHLPLSVDWIGSEELARRVAPHSAAPRLAPRARALAAVRRQPAGRRLARHRVADAGDDGAADRRGRAESRPSRLSPLRPHQLPGRSRPPARDRSRRGGRSRTALAVQVLVAGFAPDDGRANPMLDPRVRAADAQPAAGGRMARRRARDRDDARGRALARAACAWRARLPAAWVDWSAALARGARTFEAMNRRGRGYFGWPAAARASTGRRVMALRGRLIAAALLTELAAWSPGRRRAAPR